mmetsp:Transcript_39335/g.112265  ORF Transcript_39335/g.112265 Transcript_39335/m.112265 type:complete len:345 (-) Transcript_39335:151-1185(-)
MAPRLGSRTVLMRKAVAWMTKQRRQALRAPRPWPTTTAEAMRRAGSAAARGRHQACRNGLCSCRLVATSPRPSWRQNQPALVPDASSCHTRRPRAASGRAARVTWPCTNCSAPCLTIGPLAPAAAERPSGCSSHPSRSISHWSFAVRPFWRCSWRVTAALKTSTSLPTLLSCQPLSPPPRPTAATAPRVLRHRHQSTLLRARCGRRAVPRHRARPRSRQRTRLRASQLLPCGTSAQSHGTVLRKPRRRRCPRQARSRCVSRCCLRPGGWRPAVAWVWSLQRGTPSTLRPTPRRQRSRRARRHQCCSSASLCSGCPWTEERLHPGHQAPETQEATATAKTTAAVH